jgi:hypothetical protein
MCPLWHIASVSAAQRHVRSWVQTGSVWHTGKVTRLTRMYGPAVRCKRFSSTLADAVLRQCIRSPIGACAPAIMDISAHAIFLADRPRRAVRVTRARTRREDRSSIVVSSSRKTRRVIVIMSSIASWRCAVPLFVPGGRSFVPTCGMQKLRRAQGPSRLAVAGALPLAPAWPGHALAVPSTARGLNGLGRGFIGLDAREGAPFVKNRPGDAGELVGERDRQHVVV